MLNFDDHKEMSKTESELSNRPWGGALVIETELGEQHIIPLTVEENKAMMRDGEIDCNKHTEEPGCFCNPFQSLRNENVWIHRRVD